MTHIQGKIEGGEHSSKALGTNQPSPISSRWTAQHDIAVFGAVLSRKDLQEQSCILNNAKIQNPSQQL